HHPPTVKQAPPPPTVKRESSSAILAPLKLLSGCGVPGVLSGVNVDDTTIGKLSSKECSMRAVGDGGRISSDMSSSLPQVGSDGRHSSSLRESLDELLPCGEGGDAASRNDVGEGPDSSFVICEKLLRLLGRIACSGKEVSYGATTPDAAVNDNNNLLQSCYGDEHALLDDLFAHVLLALEKVVENFLCSALTREWKDKLQCEVSRQSPSEVETPRRWMTAWRQAQRRDEETWIEWRSALCRSWRRTRRESASRERSEFLNAALFHFDPVGDASRPGASSPSHRGAGRRQREQQAINQRLYALLYRMFWTCPALLLDEQTQRLAAGAGFSLDSVRQGICAVGDEEAEAEEITGFIRSLSRRGQGQTRETDLATLEEVERLFAAERRAMLRRLDAGQPPPSSSSSPATSSWPAQPTGGPHASCSPSPQTNSSTTCYSAASLLRYVEPNPIQLCPPSLTSLGCGSPAARIPDAVEGRLARHLTSPIYETAFHASDAHLDTFDMQTARRTNGYESRCVLWPAEAGDSANAAQSPKPRLVNRAESERRLPSALRTPRSVSWW
ncbi:hypothetical protein TraAM80_06600, partial [Trypanosoma rangeli]